MWGAMRAWLSDGMIPDDRELLADLTGVEYGYVLREGRDAIILEKSRDTCAPVQHAERMLPIVMMGEPLRPASRAIGACRRKPRRRLKDMNKRGLASPDLADALALTFAYPVTATRPSLAAHRQAVPPISVRPFHQAWFRRL